MRLLHCVAALFILSISFVRPAVAEQYPILFVHGFCSESTTWNTMFSILPRDRFGEELGRLYRSGEGKVNFKELPKSPALRSFAIDFYDKTTSGFSHRRVADVSIVDKVGELKAVIDAVKITTGAPKVIIVSHSMGGLVARAYVESWGLNAAGKSVMYEDDVARVVTIDTPHQGSNLATIASDFLSWETCRFDATINKAELSPGSALLNSINTRSWPVGTPLDVVVSYRTATESDGVVTRESQDARTISDYWARHPAIRAFLQTLNNVPSLHSAVLDLQVTAALIQGLVAESDRAGPAPSLANIAGTWMGSWSSSDGGGTIALELQQNGSTVTGSMEFPGSGTQGTFSGTVTATNAPSASLQWTINYSYQVSGRQCPGSFGGGGVATSGSIQATYAGSDCVHQFSDGRLSLFRSVTGPPPPLSASRRLVAGGTLLFASEFSANGTDILVGTFTLPDRTPVFASDITTTPDGRSYAVSFDSLYSVDASTGATTRIGATMTGINALTSDGAGNLWGASLSDGSVFRINKANGAATVVGRYGSGWVSSGDLAFDSRGTLWATVRAASDVTDTLVTVNAATGAATAVATNLPGNLFGLIFANNTLYALSAATNSLYAIDTTSGAVTFVRKLAFSPTGTTRVR